MPERKPVDFRLHFLDDVRGDFSVALDFHHIVSMSTKLHTILNNLKSVHVFELMKLCTLFEFHLKVCAYFADFAAVNDAYARVFSAPFPARSCVQVAAIPKGARLKVEAIAAR